MAILERFSTFASAGDVSQTAGTYNLGTSLDLGASPGDISQGGKPVYVVVEMVAALAGTSATLQALLVSGDSSTIATDGAATTHAATGAIAVGTCVAGFVVMQMALPAEGVVYDRYLGVQVVIAGATTTAGTANAYLTMNPPKWEAMADGAPTVA